MTLKVAFSPCPNDTYIFHAWINGALLGVESPAAVLADVQHLNQWALEGRYPITKLSIACLGSVLDDYVMLPVGAALGCGCGPKVIANGPIDELRGKKVAIPGKDTTAYLLFCILYGVPENPLFCLYHEVEGLLKSGAVDCGVIIHETRFTFEEAGFVEVADLGVLWEERYQLPLPLGAIAAKRSLGTKQLNRIARILKCSIEYADNEPDGLYDYIIENSQEKDLQVVRKHIELYVNEEARQLSSKGAEAIETLLREARQRGLIESGFQPFLLELND